MLVDWSRAVGRKGVPEGVLSTSLAARAAAIRRTSGTGEAVLRFDRVAIFLSPIRLQFYPRTVACLSFPTRFALVQHVNSVIGPLGHL